MAYKDGAASYSQPIQENYTYDLRWKKTNGSKVTQYSYNGADQVIGDQTSNGTISSYIRGDRVLVKKDLTNQKDYYYLYNGHGDVVQMVGTDGSLVNSYQYDEWGNLTNQKETVANEFKYAGETYDAETGLYYLKARYYDPNVGRFINEDTVEGQIDNPLSLNIYGYVQGNPLRYTDPTGNLIQESYNDGGLRDLLQQAREQITSKSDPLYAKYKSTVIETYKHFIDPNRYNYLFDLTTGTSTYGNSAGKSDWAIAQLISAYQDYELAEYIATLSMGSLGGVGNSYGKGTGRFNWNSIRGTQPVIEGTNVPKSFVITGLKVNGNEVWVGGNATKHIGEFINSANKKGGGALSENEIMKSFMNAANLASKETLQKGDNRLFVGGWEIGINGETGVIYHALMK
ncbi:RHS repeat-associated core domain-containing protein [Paenibacillus hunanensis]|uniref:RHS repeat-associated core domain-containing protein n=1 Tax=Paenibacillus hunanensis TaxID=539262 RepID=UPI002A6A0EB3|nr:RHS repeat-associated core domain-containing protein [Paenibacillus hunanensis]WPP42614.1 RHS repeat-associated core domain-containing protein [Paenibacillus hunanensis]